VPRLEGEAVIDTSVAFKFFHPEEESAEASALLASFHAGQLDFAVPDLLLVEFVNVVWTKTRAGELTVDEATKAVRGMHALSADMLIVPVVWILPSILKNCLAMEHGAYDMTYLTLAHTRGVPLVTSDQRLYRKARQYLGARSRVHLLRDLSFA
jgi:predicted nucleic acid-binding protein